MPDDRGMSKREWRSSGSLQTRARQLRLEQTPAEALLWQYLRNRQLDGFKFRRQHPIDRFVVDFCCPERRLIIEVDGAVHQDQGAYDENRTAALQALGYRVVRYTNDQVELDIMNVLDSLRHHLTADKQE